MYRATRRGFLGDVGRGILVASLGPSLAEELGLDAACLAAGAGSGTRLSLGALEPLAAVMQETPLERFLPQVIDEVRRGATPAQLVGAAALANARALGGEDYVGYHALMALAPAYAMAGSQARGLELLPILKVLYRNTRQIREHLADGDVLAPIELPTSSPVTAAALRELVRQADLPAADAQLARLATTDPEQAFNDLQLAIQDDLNVHRVVLVWRAWELLPLTGREHAATMLRQSVHFCVDGERERISRGHPAPAIRQALPRLIDQYKLLECSIGNREADDAWIEQTASLIHSGSKDDAAGAVAAALAEGFAPQAVGEAISLAAHRLILNDPGRPEKWSSPAKPIGSVHGDSIGVHAADAANAWRNIARAGQPQTTLTSLVVGAYHTAGQQRESQLRYPEPDDVAQVHPTSPQALLRELDSAVRGNDQRRACAVAGRWCELDLPTEPLFEMLRQFAVTEDGALHAEKYFQTAHEDFAALRPRFRWTPLVALARVTASQYGFPAPGVEEAVGLLG